VVTSQEGANGVIGYELIESPGAVETLMGNFGFDLALAIAVLDLLRRAWSNLDLAPQP
jgi:hypothetical protein